MQPSAMLTIPTIGFLRIFGIPSFGECSFCKSKTVSPAIIFFMIAGILSRACVLAMEIFGSIFLSVAISSGVVQPVTNIGISG